MKTESVYGICRWKSYTPHQFHWRHSQQQRSATYGLTVSCNASVAQLAEYLLAMEDVDGSSPFWCSIYACIAQLAEALHSEWSKCWFESSCRYHFPSCHVYKSNGLRLQRTGLAILTECAWTIEHGVQQLGFSFKSVCQSGYWDALIRRFCLVRFQEPTPFVLLSWFLTVNCMRAFCFGFLRLRG